MTDGYLLLLLLLLHAVIIITCTRIVSMMVTSSGKTMTDLSRYNLLISNQSISINQFISMTSPLLVHRLSRMTIRDQ